MTCFVPSCQNSIGSKFPKDNLLKEKWLKNLNLQGLEVQTDSFLCFDHFSESDLITEDHCLTRVKAGAVPVSLKNYGSRDVLKLCRICMADTDLVKKVWEPLEGEIPIMSALMLCCYPVKISMCDNWPKVICTKCLDDLTIAHRLRLRCLDSFTKLQGSMENYETTKRKLLEESKQNKKARTDSIEEVVEESIENIRKELDSSLSTEIIKIKDRGSTSTSCLKDVEYVPKPDKLNLNGLIVELTPDATLVPVKKQHHLLGQKIILPKRALEKYASPLGKFSCTLLIGVQNATFIEAKSYLYVHGLLKKKVRNLLCILPTCNAQARHVLLDKDVYEDIIEVWIPHNHPPTSDREHKKLMLFYVMRRRVQLDKSMNIKNLYDELCAMEPNLQTLVPLHHVINEICRSQVAPVKFNVTSFQMFFDEIENKNQSKLHFTISGRQFYQEKFTGSDDSLAVVFSNKDTLEHFSYSKVMYVDASFKIDTNENFRYQLVTVLLWVEESYYPVMYGFVNKKSKEIFKKMFCHLRDVLAPNLRPDEIVTDYEASIYYALGETYSDSHIGGSVFYYTQNLYKKVCALNLSRDLETNSYFRSIYHMLLMLPLLPVNTIKDGLNSIQVQAKDSNLTELVKPLFEHVQTQWMQNVTPNLFCVHCLENRINENVIAPFKKLRDFLLASKGKSHKHHITISQVVEKLIELEAFLRDLYSREDKKSFSRDLSSSQKKNVLQAWLYIETHPKININNFFAKVVGYIKCMENQLWIWGYYRHIGDGDDVLINASNFSIFNCATSPQDNFTDDTEKACLEADFIKESSDSDAVAKNELIEGCENGSIDEEAMIVMEAVFDQNSKVVIQTDERDIVSYLST